MTPTTSSQPDAFSLRMFRWVALEICFVLIPLALLYFGTFHVFYLWREVQKQDMFQKMEAVLDRASPYQDEGYFLHSLFSVHCRKADTAANPFSSIRASIKQLKKRFSNSFKFVVWDQNGEVSEKDTDILGYRFVLKKVFECFAIFHSTLRQNLSSPDSLPTSLTVSLTNILKSFFGKLLLPTDLLLPLRKSPPPNLIFSSYQSSRAYFWYFVGKQFTLLVLIDKALLRGHNGIHTVVSNLNKDRTESISIGYVLGSDLMNPLFPGTVFPLDSDLPKLLLQSGQFTGEIHETKENLVFIRYIPPQIRLIASCPKQSILFSEIWANGLIGAALVVLGIFLSRPLYKMIFYPDFFFSIRQKLFLLFFYANALPIMVIGFLGYDYLHHLKASLLEESTLRGFQILEKFEKHFPAIQKTFTDSINRFLVRESIILQIRPLPQKSIFRLVKFARRLKSNEMYLISSDSRIIATSQGLSNELSALKQDPVSLIGKSLMNIWNQNMKNNPSGMQGSGDESQTPDYIFGTIDHEIKNLGKVTLAVLGVLKIFIFRDFLPTRNGQTPDYLLMIQWERERFYQIYFSLFLPAFSTNPDGIRVFAQNRLTGQIFPRVSPFARLLPGVFQKSARRDRTVSKNLVFHGNSYHAVSFLSQEFPHMTLLSLIPHGKIEGSLKMIRETLFLCCLFTLFITFGLSQFLSNHFLEPLKNLSDASRAITQRSFSYRIAELPEDEMGDLGKLFNTVMEGLSELEVARIVQENLLPSGILETDSYVVKGRSIPMMALGGDYFDFLPTPNGHLIVLGDVAGHGVSAALSMAMAKATCLRCVKDKLLPEQILHALHTLLFSFKGRFQAHMMTFQIVLLQEDSQIVCLANAGQCYPLFISRNAEKAEFLTVPGQPLGILKQPRYVQHKFSLMSGETLLMYTDGFVEGRFPDRQDLGYLGLPGLMQRIFSNDLNVFHENIEKEHPSFRGLAPAQDDITVVLIQRKLKTHD